MDDIELETRSMVDEGAELKHGVTCLRSRPIENSLLMSRHDSFVRPDAHGRTIAHNEGDVSTIELECQRTIRSSGLMRMDARLHTAREVWLRRMHSPGAADRDARSCSRKKLCTDLSDMAHKSAR